MLVARNGRSLPVMKRIKGRESCHCRHKQASKQTCKRASERASGHPHKLPTLVSRNGRSSPVLQTYQGTIMLALQAHARKHASKQACKRASERAYTQASKHASKQASKQTSKQASKRRRNLYCTHHDVMFSATSWYPYPTHTRREPCAAPVHCIERDSRAAQRQCTERIVAKYGTDWCTYIYIYTYTHIYTHIYFIAHKKSSKAMT